MSFLMLNADMLRFLQLEITQHQLSKDMTNNQIYKRIYKQQPWQFHLYICAFQIALIEHGCLRYRNL